MPRLRLFGPVAEAAGTKVDEVDGTSVTEVLNAARARYGAAFAEQVSVCRIWVNGEVPDPGMTLQETDEVALLPPVSGG
jgi:molybdopterin converting factor small subunit